MTAPANSTETNQPGNDDGAPATGENALGDAGKAALAAERRAKRDAEKELTDARARLKEFEDRDKSEADKLAERVASAEARATTYESTALRYEVAAEAGLPLNMAARLLGSTRDELLADAKKLTETLGAGAGEQSTTLPAGGKPREVLTGGGDPTGRSGGGAMPLNGDPIEAALRKKLGIRR